ncbi:isopentenyl phosphate kinase [Methanocella paludicola SANAE]|uniref:Isopentenyl phosphate kinase n=1 Tax=Methanocella paludicola (strain DSM 17711 / JCM 13418 / NBRC 101707 / SANAE) TaxID=304371 RepID=D1YZ38_METPS|nr:isopentenyl phosphate kinase [Methanocella paludicola]BAI61710.1 isopentenyl phosphate kinase [Methanocella paludicola SANAE]
MTTILKIGGSVLTDKNRVSVAKKDAISRIAKEIGEGASPGLVLIHGAGSFGHHQAKEYRLKDGLDDWSIKGLWPTHSAVTSLNRMVVDALQISGVEALPVNPLSDCVLDNGRIEHLCLDVIRMMLHEGIVPVLHGDVAMDRSKGVDVLSGDQLVPYLACELKADRVGIGTNVDGVLDDNGNVISKITPGNMSEVNKVLSGSRGVDVTGGMQGKIRELMALAESGIPSLVFNAEKPGNVVKFLKNDLKEGTIIRGD